MTDIKSIEGIGDVYKSKLGEQGITTVAQILEKGAKPAGRKKLAESTGISPKLILKWVNLADLFRIKGLGEEYTELLEAAGVDTVVELAQRNPANLYAKLVEVNAEKKLVRRLPVLTNVEDWVAQAKKLVRAVFY